METGVQKKRKLGTSLLVLGTGSGDALALDVSAGQLKWRVNDCHPGGVTAVSYPTHGSCIYTAGADGMICELDSMTGNLVGKFRASTKAISSMSVSSDGKYIISSSIGERYVAIWRIDGSKKQSACCVLAMDHPAVFLDCKGIDTVDADNGGLYVLAISETGVCFLWYGKNIEDLRHSKATKVSLSLSESLSQNIKGAVPTVFAAKLQGVRVPESGHLFVAYGLLVKPSFEKVLVQPGMDITLNSSLDGILLGTSQSRKSKKRSDMQNQSTICGDNNICGNIKVALKGRSNPAVLLATAEDPKQLPNSPYPPVLAKMARTIPSSFFTCRDSISRRCRLLKAPGHIVNYSCRLTALDRANAEDALLQVPKIFNLVDGEIGAKPMMDKDDMEVDKVSVCMEDQLRAQGIINSDDGLTSNSKFDTELLKGINFEANIPQRKVGEGIPLSLIMRAAILSMTPPDAYKLLKVLLAMWESRSCSGKYVLAWICCILVNHSDYVISQEPDNQLLESLYKIDKVAINRSETFKPDHQMNESEDDDVEEFLYGEDEESQNTAAGGVASGGGFSVSGGSFGGSAGGAASAGGASAGGGFADSGAGAPPSGFYGLEDTGSLLFAGLDVLFLDLDARFGMVNIVDLPIFIKKQHPC
ncbi:hypothetical protein RJ640_014749 [Escallonia rubra]|uniref:Small-subunit processome Utp12 domain-containing protein n=1 Tax=Escallonia rubra TaxID=112253 RepID=A0AA88RQA3_9ASTE|nr:hypothetical protein RJ640_014749 [Escallonia rubra]